MKISSVSKKVLASALSAAMVVAFAPTVAFGAPAKANDGKSVVAEVSYELTNTATGAVTTSNAAEFYTLTKVEQNVNAATGKFYYNGALYDEAVDSSSNPLGYANAGTAQAPVKVYTQVTGSTVKLVQDVSNYDATSAAFTEELKALQADKVTIDLNGHSLTIDADATSTTQEVTISGKGTLAEGSVFENVVIAKGADVTIGAGVAINGTVTVKGNATFAAATASAVAPVVAGQVTIDNGGSATINGGTFTTRSKGITVNALVPATDTEAAKPAGALVVNGGQFKQSDVTASKDSFFLKNYVASGAELSINTTSKVVTVGQIVAYAIVSGVSTGYTTIDAALEAADASTTVKLTAEAANATTAIDLSTMKAGVKLDLAGQTLTDVSIKGDATNKLVLTGTGTLVACTLLGDMTVDKGASITVKNKVKTVAGKEQVTKSKLQSEAVGGTTGGAGDPVAPAAATITVNGTLVVEDSAVDSDVTATSTVIGKKYTVSNIDVKDGGSFTAAKGKFGDLDVAAGAKAVVNGGSFGDIAPAADAGSKKAALTVAKATYTGTALKAKYVAEGSVTNAVNAGTKEVGAPVASADIVTPSDDGSVKYTETKQFASVTGAVYGTAGQETKLVTLTADVTENVVANVAGAVIDLNGHKITGTDDTTATLTVSDNLTVKGNGTIDALKNGKNVADIAGGKKLTVKGGTFTRSAEDATNTGVIFTGSGNVDFMGGDFTAAKTAAKLGNAVTAAYMGGTFAFRVSPAAGYVLNDNGNGTYTVALGITIDLGNANDIAVGTVASGAFVAAAPAETISVSNKDDALEKAATAALSQVIASAKSANPAATTLDGIVFAKDMNVEALTTAYNTPAIDVEVVKLAVDADKVTLAKDKDYELTNVYTVELAVVTGTTVIGYLTGIDADVTYKYGKLAADRAYKFLGAEAAYNAEDEVYTFKTKTSTQFGVESISNTIKDIVDNQEQAAEKATQSIDVDKKSRTVRIGSKTKTQKALYFKMGASAETKLTTAKKSGSSRITVSGDKVTLKKGTKKGTYTAKVSLKAASSDEYLAAAKTITVKFVVKK